LIARAKAGEDDVWAALHDMIHPYLLDEAKRILGPDMPQESTSDLIQKTLQRAWMNIEGFRGGDEEDQTAALFRAWLRRIMTNVHLNDVRAENAQRRLVPPGAFSMNGPGSRGLPDGPAGFDPMAHESSVGAQLRRDKMRARIERVVGKRADPADRDLARLICFEGRSLSKAAELQSASAHKVRERLRMILQQLGPRLKDLQ
jgi:DNA-directed RNA polymerase specialized sigma24 family protein